MTPYNKPSACVSRRAGLPLLWSLWIAVGVQLAAVVAEDRDGTPITDLRLPLEYDETGALRSQLFAGDAWVPPQGAIEAKDVRVEMYDADGEVETEIRAANCRFDRETRLAESDGFVELIRADVRIAGTGFELNDQEQWIQLKSNCRVELERGIQASRRALQRRQAE